MPLFIYKRLVKALVLPFIWANRRKKQTILTRTIRAAWRRL